MTNVLPNGPLEEGSAKENAWISDILAQYGDRAWRLALRLVGQVADAEEVLQESFLKLLQQARKQPLDNPRAYLNVVIKNTAFDLLAKRKIEQAATEPAENCESQEAIDPSQSLLDEESVDQLDRAVAQLDPRLAKVVIARYLNQQSYKQIAEDLDISQNTARVYHWRAIQRLREIFPQE